KACVLPENPASYRVVRKKSYLFNKAAFTHSGATLALILGEILAEEMLCGTRHPMLATFRPERYHA
ncbi:hypothetical protein SJ402_28220, partial [Klebsiella variicola]|nr:hypothetical protein [Klebsiella variicola]